MHHVHVPCASGNALDHPPPLSQTRTVFSAVDAPFVPDMNAWMFVVCTSLKLTFIVRPIYDSFYHFVDSPGQRPAEWDPTALTTIALASGGGQGERAAQSIWKTLKVTETI